MSMEQRIEAIGLVMVLIATSSLAAGGPLAAQGGSPPEGPSLRTAPPPTVDAGDTGPWRHEVQGLTVELEIEPVTETAGEAPERLLADSEARFRFRLEDQLGAPLTGVYPAAWMDWKPPGVEGETCRGKVEAFLGGSLLSPPELDLNVYYVLAMNDDATISVVDPLFGFGTTKLLDMVFLESPGHDWVLSPDGERLYVSMPEAGRLAVVDTAAWEVLANLDVGPEPRRLALSPDGRFLWAAWGDARHGGVSAVDTAAGAHGEVVRRLETGAAPRDLVLSDDGRHLVAVAAAAARPDGGGIAVVIDGDHLKVTHRLEVAPDPVSVAWSPVAGTAWISHRPGGLTAVDPEVGRVVGEVVTPPGLGAVAFAPDGRLGFIVSPPRDELHILDAATGRLVQTADTEAEPDRVAFSDELAYLRHRGSDIVLMIPLGEVGEEGRPVPMVDFPGGQRPPGRSAQPTPAAGIVQAPGATAVLVANPEDRAIYFYKEGMAAPMGHFRNYSRQPRAVLAVDRSLRERGPGRYETTVTLRKAGRYDVAFFVDSPRMVRCFEVTVAPNPATEEPEPTKLDIRPTAPVAGQALTAGEPGELRFRVVDPASGEPMADLDLRVLTFRGGGLGQRRAWAEPTAEAGGYRVSLTPERAGVYYVFVDCPERRMAFNDGSGWVVEVTPPARAEGRRADDGV